MYEFAERLGEFEKCLPQNPPQINCFGQFICCPL